MTQTGLDVAVDWLRGGPAPPGLEDAARLLRTGRLGLVTNPSASTGDLVSAPDALRAAGASLAALFGPEHGVRGDAPDGVRVPHGTDRRTGLPVWSLYGAALGPTPEMLQGLDALVFDIQDVGARFYTFSSTLSHVMHGAALAGLPVLILDRPNPLGGDAVEGPTLEPSHASFVGLHPVPIRHAATMGELGRLWAGFGAGEAPLVVPCRGWTRREYWEETGLPWAPPSPAMPSPETALIYPGTCLLEGTPVSEGRGTACPFRWFGAPWAQAEELADLLNAEGLPGARFRPVRFSPTASKFAGESCEGCQIHVMDREAFRPVATGVALLAALRRAYPACFAWRENGGRFPVDRLAGTATVREGIEAGRSWRDLSVEWAAGEQAHRARLEGVRLYG
jgi:uncharacterized protein YbbC (DUF1343 family)